MTDLTGARITPTDRFGTPIEVGCFIRYYAPSYHWAQVALVTKIETVHERDAVTAGRSVKGWDVSVSYWTTGGRIDHGTNTWDERAAVTVVAAPGTPEWHSLMTKDLATKVNHLARMVAVAEGDLEQARTELNAYLAMKTT